MRNYPQKYVASKLGISQNAYSKIENNITQITVHHIKELSRILEVPITDLLKDEFEIRGTTVIPSHVTKAELLVHIKNLYKRVEENSATKHDAYIVVMSLVVAAENSVSAGGE